MKRIFVFLLIFIMVFTSSAFSEGLKCPSCGSSLPEKALFCPYCGTQVVWTPSAPDKKDRNDYKIGDTLFFGSYEQDNDLNNGAEPVEWQILDLKDGKAFLLSKYALDCQKYNSTLTAVTWDTSSLRVWLNEIFLRNTFSAEEQAKIITTKVDADTNPQWGFAPGNETDDKVFVLSISELESTILYKEGRKSIPTQYAVAQGAYANGSFTAKAGEATCWTWLRTPGKGLNYAAYISYDGSVNYSGNRVSNNSCAVRPALWIELDS